MLSRLIKLYHLLTNEQRKKLFTLQLLITAMAFAEIASIAALYPFMSLVGNISILEGGGKLAQVYAYVGMNSPEQFLFWLGVMVLTVIAVASIISIYTVWKLTLYSEQVGAELSVRLYNYYMAQPWLFHASGSSSQSINKISEECSRVTNQIIQPLMQMNAKVVLTFFLMAGIFVFNPVLSLVAFLIFATAYSLLYSVVRKIIARNGSRVSIANRLKFKLMSEGFGGIKDILLLNRQAFFNRDFELVNRQLARARGVALGLSVVPAYLMQFIAFTAIIFLILYLLASYQGDLGKILPVLSAYALAGYKLLPGFQIIYSSVAKIKGNLAAFDSIKDDLEASANFINLNNKVITNKYSVKEAILLENITFYYPNKNKPALSDFTLTIPINQTIGLVGVSGSGKSTAIDILLGLIEPQKGYLKVDGKLINADEKKAWQSNIGYVPQSIFLADSNIRENIAFGLPVEEIEDARVKRAVKMAHLDYFVDQLSEGLNTRVGERGVQLSGGQRQRIGLARALYGDTEVLVFDEATSALDGITERLVMEEIQDFTGKRTIVIIAHRVTTLMNCDCIYVLDDGKIVDFGTYDELIKRNEMFIAMASTKTTQAT